MCLLFTVLATLATVSIAVVLCTYTVTKPPEDSDVHSLNGIWRLQNINKFADIDVAAIVPGGIYTDLMTAKIIPNIYLEQNDVDLRWVAKDNWTYYREFSVEDKLKEQSAYLVFEGLDTVATIVLNGQIVGQSKNMFLQYKFYISKYLEPGTNSLEVRFKSPVQIALTEFNREKWRRKGVGVPPECPPAPYNGECHVNHLRKQQASFSWDWGPAFPNVGIWKNVYLTFESSFMFNAITVNTQKIGVNDWNLTVTGFFDGQFNGNDSGIFQLILVNPDNQNQSFTCFKEFNFTWTKGNFNVTHSMVIKDVIEPWWPNQFGNQKLYVLKAILTIENGTSKSLIRNIGFRTIELVEDAENKTNRGLTFYFKVNGEPIFMKGSNWIPSNILPEVPDTTAGRQTILRLLSAAKWANMNMLRVWGGGVYETDYFYELTDRFGILIWHDMMFACAMYPANDKFLTNVAAEITWQVQRLQFHPSIALWAGNNENELALRQNWYKTYNDYDRFRDEYLELYIETIGPIVANFDKTRPYIPSSPSNGKESAKEGFISRDPGSSFYGDVHFYNYISDAWDPNIYPRPRFASEYGVQSLPYYLTLLNATTNPNEDLKIGSLFMNHRQHHPLGYTPIEFQISNKFSNFSANKSDVQLLKEFIYQSQIVQAMAMKIETENYRQLRSFSLSSGEGLTMGALYWQLNDVWQAPSWSSIDFAGRWKMLHYFAKNFFAPILISATITKLNEIIVYINSDKPNPIDDCTAIISLYKWNDFSPVCSSTNIELKTLKPASSEIIFRTEESKYLESCNCDKESCFLYLSLVKNDLNHTKLSPDNFYLLTYPNQIKGLKNPEFKIHLRGYSTTKTAHVFTIEISAKSIGLFVWLQTPIAGFFSDNGFIMAEPTKTVEFHSEIEISLDNLRNNIFVSSVNDMSQLI